MFSIDKEYTEVNNAKRITEEIVNGSEKYSFDH